ncbi:hypothetical protein [Paenibacillus protaetiae]|uniref:Uncharacterized protein n=1 Tax=Paenibacillus protaetiae TaxID=2509456 RepID=A0A4P6EX88_9BACL|nr:hypothetical protein [Paenibacillus protaetiae]QAY67674.1 hypothetical protein ET464_16095 [Paenibacillus protaetiae]
MRLSKGIVWLLAIMIGLLFAAPHHMSVSLGEQLFGLLGLPAHVPAGGAQFRLEAIIGIVFIIAGMIGVYKVYGKGRISFGIGLWIAIAVCAEIYPHATAKLMTFVYYDADGPRSVAYNPEESSCSLVKREGKTAQAECRLVLYNYGRLSQVTLMPVLVMPERLGEAPLH